MGPFEYISVLLSIVISLALALQHHDLARVDLLTTIEGGSGRVVRVVLLLKRTAELRGNVAIFWTTKNLREQ